MKFNRVWAMPNHETFSIPPIAEFVERYRLPGYISVDPYARNRTESTYTNDLNPATTAQQHKDAIVFMRDLADEGIAADLVILDPPYSPRQVKECYDAIGMKMGQTDALLGFVRKQLYEQVARILVPGGVILKFGWNTTGIGKKYGMTLEEVLLVCHGSDHNDTICIAERRGDL